MTYGLSVDLGTTALKAVIADEAGRTIASAGEGYRTTGEHEGYAEQNPNDWWEAFCRACRQLKDCDSEAFEAIEFVAFCGQMHTHVYLDDQGVPLRSAITWMDQRSAEIAERFAADPDTGPLIKREAANNITPTYTAPNLLWVQRNDPDTWQKTRAVLVAKDYIKYRLTGAMVTDPSEAAGTLLYNVARQEWSSTLLELFSISPTLLPEVAPAGTVIGHVGASAAEQTGIAGGTPVINGATDNSTAALGAGVTEAGDATLIIGTAGVVSVCSEKPIPDPNEAVVCWNYCVPDRWINLGVMQTAGESLNWFRRAFDGDNVEESEDVFSTYNELVRSVPDGSDGLFFLPYLNGERTPHWDSNARGVFFGAGLGTRKAHFIKAVMEGVAMALRNNAETVEALGQPIGEVRAVGGGLQSRPWLEILSRVLEKPIRLIDSVDPPVRGNIALGRSALGQISTVRDMVRTEGDGEYLEAPGTHSYDARYEVFLELYRQLRDVFEQRARLYSN